MSIRSFSLLVLLFSFVCTVNAQRVKRKGVTPIDVSKKVKTTPEATYSLEQFNGKWQETGRTGLDDKPVSFTDSIQLHFMGEDKVITRVSSDNKMSMKGVAQIDEDMLLIAADAYTVKSVTKDEIVLADDDYIHRLAKTDTFLYETRGKTPVSTNEYAVPIITSLADITGKWSVYRRQAKPGFITTSSTLIRNLTILEKTSDNMAKGEIIMYKNGASEQLPCTITLAGSNLQVVAGSQTFNMSVYKADKKEFIFGSNEEIMYYAKPL